MYNSVMTPLSSTTWDAGAVTAPDLDERRAALLEAAARLLAEEGPHALSLRRIAADAGGSTQLVYTLFGGKPGLAAALYGEGFRRLGARIADGLTAAPPPGDPERLAVIGRAYLAFAADEPAFFAVMFGRAIPGFTPPRGTQHVGRERTFGVLVDNVQACLTAGTLVGGTAEDLARLCWLTVHGLASLEAAGMVAPASPDAFVDLVLHAPLAAHRP